MSQLQYVIEDRIQFERGQKGTHREVAEGRRYPSESLEDIVDVWLHSLTSSGVSTTHPLPWSVIVKYSDKNKPEQNSYPTLYPPVNVSLYTMSWIKISSSLSFQLGWFADPASAISTWDWDARSKTRHYILPWLAVVWDRGFQLIQICMQDNVQSLFEYHLTSIWMTGCLHRMLLELPHLW